MRDRLLSDSLTRLSSEAAIRLSALVAAGDHIPFDVDTEDGEDSLFYSYRPLTGRYVRERERELRSLPSFDAAREAVEAAGVAAAYLEARGEQVPSDSAARAEAMLVVFLASLWEGCTELSLDGKRLEAALATLDAETRSAEDAEVLIAPLVGLRMSIPRLQLPRGVEIVRADTIDAPVEAMQSEGMERSAWQPQFLAIAEQGEGSDSAGAALRQLHELISVMRLFKGGGVGLGPHAFAPTGEGHWRRIATGAPATRPGGYDLSEEEARELVGMAGALEARPDPDGALSWAVARFEMGCARESALDGLSDHLLALRAVLDGRGPVGASLPMRAAALIAADSGDRISARERIEDVLELERSLMSGARGNRQEALELANWLEVGVRAMLRDAALGELGTDLNTVADETLIANGLEAGDAEITITAQDLPDPAEPEFSEPEPQFEEPEIARSQSTYRAEPPREEEYMEQETRIMEPVPEEDEIRITATNWLEEVAVEESTLDFPAVEDDIDRRERIDTPRVRHLFPVPEDADWQVRELDYDHYNRHAS